MDKAFVDSCCWLSLFKGEKTAQAVLNEIKSVKTVLTGSLNLLEAAYKIEGAAGAQAAAQFISTLMQKAVVVDFCTDDLWETLRHRRTYNLAAIDAVTAALAKKSQAQLLTLDRDFEGVPNVRLIE